MLGNFQDMCIHQLFEFQVKRSPDAIAVVFEGKQLTYQELNSQANQLAHYLKTLGIGPEVLVAACVERSLEMVVGLLGILKAGGAYVPLDPNYPPNRLAFMLEHSQTPVLLTQQRLVESLSEHQARVICLDGNSEIGDRFSEENPDSGVTPDNLAYVIYTSGSTGQPKGVAIAHSGAVNTLLDIKQRFEVGSGDRVLALSSLSFDLSVYDIFGLLAAGGTVVIPKVSATPDPAHWVEAIARSQVTIWNSAPALMQMLVDYAAAHSNTLSSSLRLVLLSGDWIPLTLPDQIRALVKSELNQPLPSPPLSKGRELDGTELASAVGQPSAPAVIGLGGATEASIWSILYPIETVDPAWKSIPYGRSMTNQQFYALNEAMEPCQEGEVGELYIGGIGLARCYWRDEEKTNKRFITHPHTGDRLYCTGDLGRYLPDGNIEFQGRIDHQVKIRGFRIELGEIEAVLGQHPDVQVGVVAAQEDVPGQKRLVAYVVSKVTAERTPFKSECFAEFDGDRSVKLQTEDISIGGIGVIGVPDHCSRSQRVRLRLVLPGDTEEQCFEGTVAWCEGNQAGIELAITPTKEAVIQQSIDYLLETQGFLKFLQSTAAGKLRNFLKDKLPDYMVPASFVFLKTLPLTLNGKIDRQKLIAPAVKIPELRQDYVASQTPVEDLKKNIDSLAPEMPASFHPLSLGQQALWFLYQIDPESVAYNIFDTALIRSSIDIPVLQRAWQKILNRHPILRTTYTTYEGKPFQQIHEQLEVTLQVTDASNWSEDYLKEQILLENDRQFNLEKDPIWRLNLFTRSAQEHILLLTMHHIASDSWSYDLLFTELSVWYTAETEKVSPEQIEDSLPKNLPYTEFVHWQSEMLSGPKGEKLWKYWQKQLSGELPILNLPTDRPRPPVQSDRGGTHIFQLDEQLIQGLREVASSTGTSLYKLMLSAYFVLLYRYTNQEDILVGSPMLGRPGREFKGVVGYFVNPAVLRASISANLAFKDFLAQVSSQVKEAQRYQDYPFPLLVEKLQPQRDISRSHLFQVSFTWQKQRWSDSLKNSSRFQSPGLEMEPYPLGHQPRAIFDLDVMMMEMGEVIHAGWQYNTDLFDASTISRMAGHFQTLLEAIATNPKQPISELPLLTQRERHQLLVKWNNTAKDYPQDKCIHQLFEEQVELTPDAIALVFEDQQLTYKELNQRANQLAHHLGNLGVGPEVLVGICVERSLEMVVGLLGILKAGGAYVPLDPAYPPERLVFMLEDAQVRVLLTQARLVESLPKHQGRIVCLDTDWEIIERQSEANLISEVKLDNLAYVIYTSGSTGQPKGVQVLHSAVVNFLTSMGSCPGLTDQDTLLSVTTLSFDIAGLEIFLPLSVGGRLVMVSRSVATDGTQLLERLNDCVATVLQATPATWRLLLAAGWSGSHQLKILCGGEALSRELANQLLEKGASLWNLYGPTEATIWSTIDRVDNTEGTVCIGRPIANTQIYLLDEHLQPVPVGVPGELYIGGAGLARGYLNRPELTAQKFIVNPLSQEPNARLYKTGDLARYQRDGNIEYLGRIDHQVKVRGFRIELGEIEAVLSQHPDIQESVVINREDASGNQRLVAYITSHLRLERVPYQSSCLAEFGGSPAVELRTEDISIGGVCIIGVPDAYQPGQPIRLYLRLPGLSEEQWLQGRLVWRQGQQCGIQFALTQTEQILVQQSIDYLLESQGFLKVLQRTAVGSLRSFLKQKLPDYMIPSGFVFLNHLPLTPNGKVDRKALPAPDAINPELETTYIAPQTEVEQSIATVWQQVLHLEKVGVDDNFFDLGGHSLLMAQAHSQLREVVDRDVSIMEMFKYPTIRSLAKYLSEEPEEKSSVGQSRDRINKQKDAINRQKQKQRSQGKNKNG